MHALPEIMLSATCPGGCQNIPTGLERQLSNIEHVCSGWEPEISGQHPYGVFYNHLKARSRRSDALYWCLQGLHIHTNEAAEAGDCQYQTALGNRARPCLTKTQRPTTWKIPTGPVCAGHTGCVLSLHLQAYFFVSVAIYTLLYKACCFQSGLINIH